MKVIVSVCERVAVESGWEANPGRSSVTEVVVLDSPISMKQLRCGLTTSKFEKWNLGLPCKDPFDGKIHWIETNSNNFSDDFVSFHAETNDDGSHMLSLAAWPEFEPNEHVDPKEARASNSEFGYPVIKTDSQIPAAPVTVNISQAPKIATATDAFTVSAKQMPIAVKVDADSTENNFEIGHHQSHGHHHHHGHHPHGPHHHHGFRRHPFSNGPGGPVHLHRFGPHGVPVASPFGPSFGRFGGPPGRRTGHAANARSGRHQRKGRKIQALARFIEHLTLPDDTNILPGEKCVKIWSVRNDSLMAWPEKCELVQVGGPNLLTSSKSVPVNGGLKPGEIKHISLDLTFPEQNGLYHAFFRLRAIDPATNEPGFKFGQRLWVKAMVTKSGNGSRLATLKSLSSSSSSSSSSSGSSSDSDSDAGGRANCPDQQQRRVRKANKKMNKKLKKRDKSILKLQKQCSKLQKKLERKSKKLEGLLSAKAKADQFKPPPQGSQ
uniref:Nbr1 FW domain-containing protein n=1 Tax=Aplanochytrium stocchinoi TaxID=215587 RepID=A0A7S3PQN5_9STRA|mmetsp:Transcript_17910/g.21922  ORF Transcript_17910/g.21922 Transcript_17910/m.21922 type:complete len:493 (-) Transcript_17910:121-1599(-)|eukprot:CAMPEP_0204822064 /NCGR_PEP_ID=MMETSP1346-20131115/244_1 /ASSEMBLY_ACC=CAM_ASM_000771 /TAXON_ID=215587 /ORGANISM="Aplanochytrium stocchinoi, Strain GSBS06" /LENGTH=492 /DNA_ID=CAMNT_0051948081 /DNA_START=402 /DNA_END=1880 /DNA_ORIENTATION=+